VLSRVFLAGSESGMADCDRRVEERATRLAESLFADLWARATDDELRVVAHLLECVAGPPHDEPPA
jgi:hypothetical protein